MFIPWHLVLSSCVTFCRVQRVFHFGGFTVVLHSSQGKVRCMVVGLFMAHIYQCLTVYIPGVMQNAVFNYSLAWHEWKYMSVRSIEGASSKSEQPMTHDFICTMKTQDQAVL